MRTKNNGILRTDCEGPVQWWRPYSIEFCSKGRGEEDMTMIEDGEKMGDGGRMRRGWEREPLRAI